MAIYSRTYPEDWILDLIEKIKSPGHGVGKETMLGPSFFPFGILAKRVVVLRPGRIRSRCSSF